VNRKATKDEQFKNFVEVIQKLYIHVPLVDAMQVPTYATYLKDMINKKKPIPSIEMVKLTKQCSAAILNQLPEKKKDPGNPTISCSLGPNNLIKRFMIWERALLMQKVDLQTQRANTRFQTLRHASRFDLTIGKGDNSNTLVPTTATRPDATAKRYSRGT